MVDLEKLLKKAKAHLEISGDNKALCETEELRALLEAGAQPMVLNHQQAGGYYIHEVMYKEVRFVNATRKPIQELPARTKQVARTIYVIP